MFSLSGARGRHADARLLLCFSPSLLRADIHDQLTDADAEKALDSEKKIKTARAAKKGVQYGGFIGGSIIVLASVIALVYLCKAAPAAKRF